MSPPTNSPFIGNRRLFPIPKCFPPLSRFFRKKSHQTEPKPDTAHSVARSFFPIFCSLPTATSVKNCHRCFFSTMKGTLRTLSEFESSFVLRSSVFLPLSHFCFVFRTTETGGNGSHSLIFLILKFLNGIWPKVEVFSNLNFNPFTSYL